MSPSLSRSLFDFGRQLLVIYLKSELRADRHLYVCARVLGGCGMRGSASRNLVGTCRQVFSVEIADMTFSGLGRPSSVYLFHVYQNWTVLTHELEHKSQGHFALVFGSWHVLRPRTRRRPPSGLLCNLAHMCVVRVFAAVSRRSSAPWTASSWMASSTKIIAVSRRAFAHKCLSQSRVR